MIYKDAIEMLEAMKKEYEPFGAAIEALDTAIVAMKREARFGAVEDEEDDDAEGGLRGRMTKEQAIEMLKSKVDGHADTSYEWAETVRMAINALETVERIEERKRELEKKLHSTFSLSDATEHYALVRLLEEVEDG